MKTSKRAYSHGKALFQAHMAVFFMGMAGVVAGASGFEPWRSTSYRVTFGGLALGAVAATRRDLRWPPLQKLFLYAVLGLLLSVHWFAFFRSIELLGVMLGSALIGLEPLIIAISARFILKESLSKRMKVAMFLSLLGFVILGLAEEAQDIPLWHGASWAILSYGLFAILVLANRVWVQGESPLVLTTVQMLSAAPLTILMVEERWFPSGLGEWGFALSLGFLCTALAYSLYNSSMRVLSAPLAGLLLSLEVAYGILGGWVIGDMLSPQQFLAVFFISNILFLDSWIFLKKWRKTKQGELV